MHKLTASLKHRTILVSAYFVYFYLTHLYYFEYISTNYSRIIMMTTLGLSLTCALLSLAFCSTIIWAILIALWSLLSLLFPYALNVAYPILTLTLITSLLLSLKDIRIKYFGFYLVTIYVSLFYGIIAYKKIFNPIWRDGSLLTYYSQNEIGTIWLNHCFQNFPKLPSIMAALTIGFELLPVLLLFKKFRRLSILGICLFHLGTMFIFKIYEIAFAYLIFYFVYAGLSNEIKNPFSKSNL